MSKKLNEILHDIQVNLSVPKGRYNSFAKYYYRSAEDIIDAVKKLLPEGIILIVTDEVIVLGNRFYVKAEATVQDNEHKIKALGWAREPEEKKGSDASQITGSASSYARKYALNGLFAIDDGVDADGVVTTSKPETKAPKPPKIETPEETEALRLCRVITKALEGQFHDKVACLDYWNTQNDNIVNITNINWKWADTLQDRFNARMEELNG